MIYIGSPYSHPDPLVREERYLRASKILTEYLKAGRWAYSPIVHCHELAKIWDLPKEAEFWRSYDFHMLALATEFHILCLEGWAASVGLTAERVEAERLQIPVRYI